MTQDEAELAITQRWITGWNALHGTSTSDPIPHTFADESFDSVAVWVHVAIEPTMRQRSTQGRQYAKYQQRGIVRIRLFGDINTGAHRLTELAAEAIGALEEVRLGSLIMAEGSSRISPSDGRWAMRTVTVPYRVEEQSVPSARAFASGFSGGFL